VALRGHFQNLRDILPGVTTAVLTNSLYGLAFGLTVLSALIIFAVTLALAVAMNAGNVTGYIARTVADDDDR
jgi:spermidine/putrescine transport system permease protein